ncbi:hypothetical protein M8J76_014119 [Diaphorina citri]|nr:hypothetical protein M8J76_006189 [Diaphorina citri]KAI5716890.1 hypothetical protein M8J76_014119 [Diaphorina citri]
MKFVLSGATIVLLAHWVSLSPVPDGRTTLTKHAVRFLPITIPTFGTAKTTSKPINETTTKKPVLPSNLPTFLVKQIVKILKTHIFNFAKTVHPEVEKNAALVQELDNLVKDHAQEIVEHQQHPDAFSSRGLLGLITKTTKIAFRLVEKAARLVVSVVKNTANAVAAKAVDVFKSETAMKIIKDVVDTAATEITKEVVDRGINEVLGKKT